MTRKFLNGEARLVFPLLIFISKESAQTKTDNVARHGLMLLWFKDLMNVTEVKIHRPNVSTLLSNAFIRGDLNAALRSFYTLTD